MRGTFRTVSLDAAMADTPRRLTAVCIRRPEGLRITHLHLSEDGPAASCREEAAGGERIRGNSAALRELIRQTSRALRERNRELEALTENIPGGVQCCRNDEEFTILNMNSGLPGLFGYTRTDIEERFGGKFARMIHPADLPGVQTMIAEQLSRGPAIDLEYRVVCRDGSFRWVLDKGQLRTAEPVAPDTSEWQVNEWVKKAVILYFPIQPMRKMEAGELEWYDKMELKHGYEELGVRVVPHAVARYGAYIAPGAILMPSYVNIGAYVDTGTMVDTWATVGSCAQIGKHVHLSGGVGIGGVLEPVQAAPVIIEDNCFIGSRCIVVEGAHVCREAVLGSNTVITGSTHIIDVTGPEPVTYKGYVPPRSVVVPGSYRKQFPAGEYSVTCALIIGQRKESTDKKTSLNNALRDFGVSV